jgi:hypothetical protein
MRAVSGAREGTRMIIPGSDEPQSERVGGSASQGPTDQATAAKTTIMCLAPGCGRPQIASIQQQPVCLTHFQMVSFTRLEELAQNMHAWRNEGSMRESALNFIEEAYALATSLSQEENQMNSEDRARLFTICFWASQLELLAGRDTHN